MNADDGAVEVHGEVAAGFEPVVAAFQAGIVEPRTTGAAMSVWRGGREVVNVWAGTADARSGSAWAADTTGVLFSCSKGLASIVIGRLAAAGRINLDAPLAALWPEFGVHGKAAISIADVLAHRAGLSAPREDLTLAEVLDSRFFASFLAAQRPLWEPGSGHSYHALTFGALVQEIVRRATGRELNEIFADEVAGPLHADVSLKPGDNELDRIAWLVTDTEWGSAVSPANPSDDEWIARGSTLGSAFPRGLVRGDQGFNDHRVLRAGVAGAGGVGTASGLAKIWSATVVLTEGISLLDESTVKRLVQERSAGPWVFDPKPPYQRWGTGVQLSSAVTPWLTPGSFGHDGAGGQCGVADPHYGVGFGYVTNRMNATDRVAPVLAALARVLGPIRT